MEKLFDLSNLMFFSELLQWAESIEISCICALFLISLVHPDYLAVIRDIPVCYALIKELD